MRVHVITVSVDGLVDRVEVFDYILKATERYEQLLREVLAQYEYSPAYLRALNMDQLDVELDDLIQHNEEGVRMIPEIQTYVEVQSG